MTILTEELTPDDLELIEFARTIIDANTDAEYGVHTMGAFGLSVTRAGNALNAAKSASHRRFAPDGPPGGAGLQNPRI